MRKRIPKNKGKEKNKEKGCVQCTNESESDNSRNLEPVWIGEQEPKNLEVATAYCFSEIQCIPKSTARIAICYISLPDNQRIKMPYPFTNPTRLRCDSYAMIATLDFLTERDELPLIITRSEKIYNACRRGKTKSNDSVFCRFLHQALKIGCYVALDDAKEKKTEKKTDGAIRRQACSLIFTEDV